MQFVDLRGRRLDRSELLSLVPRPQLDPAQAAVAAAELIAEVRAGGTEALLRQSERFDRVRPASLRVPADEIAAATAALPAPIRNALETAIDRVRRASAAQVPPPAVTLLEDGAEVVQRWQPVERVGLYVPGGKAVYPSSVVMNVVPAQVAGVESLVVASPPQPENGGLPDTRVLAACALLGVEEVYGVGGAQAIAMLGYGSAGRAGSAGADGTHEDETDRCEPVDVITGPGNIWVTAAKRLLQGTVGIDAEAGPTEIAILADDTASPAHVAADLISQAEHDPVAASVLVTDSPELAEAVEAQLAVQVPATKHEARVREALGGRQSGIVLVDDLEQGLRVVDAYAAEHLEIQTRDARAWAMRVRNAGAIFVGAYSPVSLGDYAAGSNHVLPTAGCARHSSGLSVQSFLRGIHVVEYDEAALRDVVPHVVALANAEDLPAHGQAVTARFPS
jgi:histidinol dehydrogenase